MSETKKPDPWRRARLRTGAVAAYGMRAGPYGSLDADDAALSEQYAAGAVDDAMFRGRDAGIQALAAALGVMPLFVHEAWCEAVAEAAAAGFAVKSLDPLKPPFGEAYSYGPGKSWSSAPGVVCTDRIMFDPLSREPHVPISPDVSVMPGVVLPSEHGSYGVYGTYAGLGPVLDAVPALMRAMLSKLRRHCEMKAAYNPDVVHDVTTVFGPLVEFSVTPLSGSLMLGARFVDVYKAAPRPSPSR